MASIYNPKTKNLIVLSVKIRATGETISYLFPLNPASLSINQASRVSATFTYGAKVFQNLGAGLKTLSFEGHTGYRLDREKYGLQGAASELAFNVSPAASPGAGHWLDLYSLIQLIKGENKYISRYQSITDEFSVDNIDDIETVKITIPDQGMTYDVLLQNDNFMRNREQPHLYKYKLDFIVIQESFGTELAIYDAASEIPDTGSLVASCSKLASTLTNIKKAFMSLPGIQAISDAVDRGIKYTNDTVTAGNFFITQANSAISDLRRLERMTDVINRVSANISLIRGIVTQLKTFSSLSTAFYEPYIALKQFQIQPKLLKKSMLGDQHNLAFNINLTRLASISAPVTLAANKATVAQFQKDMRKLNRISFPFPIDRVEEVTTNGITKINVFFKTRPASFGISGVKIYAVNDFGNENDLVEVFSDSKLVLSTNYNTTGYIYNFFIEYNYTTFESIIQTKYKSIKRILIQKGNSLESIVKRYAPNEANASRTYLSEVAYLNDIEYPYVVTSDNPNFNAYFGSYGYKIFTTNAEFMSYIYNIDASMYPGLELPTYDTSPAILDDPLAFLLQEIEVVEQIKTGSKFFVLLFKETYSNRCYALFGIFESGNALPHTLFNANSYVVCALEKGRSYDINTNALFEILSPYTLTSDLIDYYGQRAFFEQQASALVPLFETEVDVIEQIYIENVGSFIPAGSFPFTQSAADKVFLAGDDENNNYVILTNFTAVGEARDSYVIAAFSKYSLLTDGQEIKLPSLEDRFLPFAEAFTREDTYKVDLDVRFQYLDDIHVSILPRPDLGSGQGVLEFKLISGLDNVKQAIKNRLECPQGGLILHRSYGLPDLLGRKNTLEHLILLRYNLFNQLTSDVRVRSANDIQLKDVGDAISAQVSVVLVNNDNVLINTKL